MSASRIRSSSVARASSPLFAALLVDRQLDAQDPRELGPQLGQVDRLTTLRAPSWASGQAAR